MDITKKTVQKMLNANMLQLNEVIANIDSVLAKMETDFYRVSIFGSARITQDSKHYKQVYDLAYQLALREIDIVTGGGPGLMHAANKGAKDAGKKSRSIGLAIELPYENDANAHLDIKRQHKRFSSRLDEFMRISHAVVVTPGGTGTLLELFYSWQLIQVNHVERRPIILLGGDGMWAEFLTWARRWLLSQNLIGEEHLDLLVYCETIEEAIKTLEPEIATFQAQSKKNSGTIG